MIGRAVEMEVDATADIASSDAATTYWTVGMPVNTTIAAHLFTAYVKDPNTDTVTNLGFALHVHATSANNVLVYKASYGQTALELQRQWSNGVAREVWVKGTYRLG